MTECRALNERIVFVEASTTGAGVLANHLARRDGFGVTLLTRNRRKYEPDALSAADVIDCETNDVDAVVDAVCRLAADSSVAAITTTADMYVPQAAFAAQVLGLPGLTYEAALRGRNKYRMRMALAQRAPEYNVPFALVQTANEALVAAERLGFPLIVKPQEENDGVGVKLIHDDSQLADYFGQISTLSVNSAGQTAPPGVLLEAYVHGPEFSVETIQYRGSQCQVMGVTTKELTGQEGGHFVEAGHAFPYTGDEAEVAAAAVRRVLAALEMHIGAIHTECRVTPAGVKIIEINPRLAGGKIGSHLIEMATGCSAVQGVIDAALGRSPSWRPIRNTGAAIHFLWADYEGTFRCIANRAELLALPGIVDVRSIACSGARVRRPQSNADYVGEILAEGRTPEQAYAHVKEAVARAHLTVEPA